MFEPIIVEHLPLDPDQRTIRVPLHLKELRKVVGIGTSVSTGRFHTPAITGDWQWYLKIYPSGQNRHDNELIVYVILANVGESKLLKNRVHVGVKVHNQNQFYGSAPASSQDDKLFDWETKVNRWSRHALRLSGRESATGAILLEVHLNDRDPYDLVCQDAYRKFSSRYSRRSTDAIAVAQHQELASGDAQSDITSPLKPASNATPPSSPDSSGKKQHQGKQGTPTKLKAANQNGKKTKPNKNKGRNGKS